MAKKKAPELLATEMEGEGVSADKGKQKPLLVIRGTSEYGEAVTRMARFYRVPAVTLYDMALAEFARNHSWTEELPPRTSGGND